MTGHASTSRVRSYRIQDWAWPWRAEILDASGLEQGYGLGFTRRGAIRDANRNQRARQRLRHRWDARDEVIRDA